MAIDIVASEGARLKTAGVQGAPNTWKGGKNPGRQAEAQTAAQPVAAVASTLLQLCQQAEPLFESSQSACSIHASSLFDLALAEAKLAASGVTSEEHESEGIYRLAALLRGVLEVDKIDRPNDHERHALIEKAFKLADAASISFGFSMEPCEMLAAGITAGEQAKEVPNLNSAQFRRVLEEIAGQSKTLCNLLMLAQTEKTWTASNCLDAGLILAQGIGAMADTATGAGVHGDADHWNYGPNFKEAV